MSPKAEQYFGVTTKAFVNDGALNGTFIICDNTERYAVYNVVDDYFADSIDLLERELLKQVRSKMSCLRIRLNLLFRQEKQAKIKSKMDATIFSKSFVNCAIETSTSSRSIYQGISSTFPRKSPLNS